MLRQPRGQRAAAGAGADDDEIDLFVIGAYCRIGEPAAGLEHIRARAHLWPAGRSCQRTLRIGPPMRRAGPGHGFRRLPWVAPVGVHPHIAARAGRAAEADLAPGGRVPVIGLDNIRQQALGKKQLGRNPQPNLTGKLAMLQRVSNASAA